MKTKTVTLTGKAITMKINPDSYRDETDRMARARNVSAFLKDNWDVLSSLGKSITFKRVRDLMIECLGDTIKNSKGDFLSTLPSRGDHDIRNREVRAGDDRAHGDTLGQHCLMLECENRIVGSKRTKVLLLNEKNIEKISLFQERVRGGKVDLIF
jgi:hypothetical protein